MSDPQTLRRWDVVCRVVDHYGDAGVCLRVARALASLPGRDVRLLIDCPAVVLALIQPLPAGSSETTWHDRSGVVISRWDAPPREVDVVLETFGGDLPPALLADLQARRAAGRRVPVWLNLEHLSAEGWVEGCHGLPSPLAHGLRRWFLFPGFSAQTAGLPGPQQRLPAWPAGLERLVRGDGGNSGSGTTGRPRGRPGGSAEPDNGVAPNPARAPALIGSVFCYCDSPLPAMLDAMQHGPRNVRLLVPAGMPGDLGGRELGAQPGSTWHGGSLTLVRMPFVDQDVYDTLLAACDFNIVRGEDSFVRAQWAARPLLWAAYRQTDDAHQPKVEAWLARCAMPPAWAALNRWFNAASMAAATPTGGGDQLAAGSETASQRTPTEEPQVGAGAAGLWAAAAAEVPSAHQWAATWRDRLATLPRTERALTEFALSHLSTLE